MDAFLRDKSSPIAEVAGPSNIGKARKKSTDKTGHSPAKKEINFRAIVVSPEDCDTVDADDSDSEAPRCSPRANIVSLYMFFYIN